MIDGDKRYECPQCGNKDIDKFQAQPLGAGMWKIRCAVCGCYSIRFAPVGNKAKTREVIEWLESEAAK